MIKIYRIDEVAKEIGVKEHTIYNWIRYGVPERLKPKKSINKDLGRSIYTFTKKDLFILNHVKELKRQNLNYEQIQEALEGPRRKEIKEPIQEEAKEDIKPINKGKYPIKKAAIGAYALHIMATVFIINKIRRKSK